VKGAGLEKIQDIKQKSWTKKSGRIPEKNLHDEK
jgi:hypothetical protein